MSGNRYSKHILTSVRNALTAQEHEIAKGYESRYPGVIVEAQKGLALQDNTNNGVISESVREEDGVIYLPPFITEGVTGPDWILWLEGNDFNIGRYAKQVFHSSDFKPSKPGTVVKIAILRGTLFKDEERETKNIYAFAENFKTPDNRGLMKPNAESVCLIRKKFTDKEIEAMGLARIVAMHEPINDSDSDPILLGAGHVNDDDVRSIHGFYGRPDGGWVRDRGFAFELSQPTS